MKKLAIFTNKLIRQAAVVVDNFITMGECDLPDPKKPVNGSTGATIAANLAAEQGIINYVGENAGKAYVAYKLFKHAINQLPTRVAKPLHVVNTVALTVAYSSISIISIEAYKQRAAHKANHLKAEELKTARGIMGIKDAA